ncbi:hypothetical protein KJ940_02590, partial [Myxococcota bacterium]|nr:hypothetical protein [Myxococcota bacterium]
MSRADFVLEVAGLLARYYAGQAPPEETPAYAPSSAPYADLNHLIGVSGGEDSVEEIGGVAEVTPITVTLATLNRGARSIYDPGLVFTRLQVAQAGFTAQLTRTLEADDASTVYIDADPASLTTPAWVHLGAETLLVTAGAGSSSDPHDPDPFRLTIGARGVGGTRPQNHIITARGAGRPMITQRLIHWIGRRAALRWWNGRAYEDVARGFLASTPKIDSDGLSLTLEIAPLTTRLDRELGDQSPQGPVGLAQGWHHYEEDTYLQHGQVWPEAHAVFTYASEDLPADGQEVICGYEQQPTTTHAAIFDVGRPPGCPRAGALQIDGQDPLTVTGYSGYTFLTEPNTPRLTSAHTGVANIAAAELHTVTFPAGLHRLDELVSLVNAAWAPGSRAGDDGQWMNVTLRPLRRDLLVAWNTTRRGMRDAYLWLWNRIRARPETLETRRRATLTHVWEDGSTPSRPHPRLSTEWVGFDLRRPDDDSAPLAAWEREEIIPRDIEQGYSLPIRGLASAWYRPGEGGLLVDAEILIPAEGLNVEVVYTDDAGDAQIKAVRATACGPKGDAAYWLELDPRDHFKLPPLRDGLDDNDPVVIRPARAVEGLAPGLLLLQLLISGGDGASQYDVLPFGAGLSEDEVDVDSCLRLTSLTPGPWSLSIPEGESLREILRPILIDTGAALIVRPGPDGRLRLAAAPITPETRAEARLHIAACRWGTTPALEAIEDLRNAFAFSVNFDAQGEAQAVIRIKDPAAIAQLGREETLELDLRGKHIDRLRGGDPYAALLPLASRLSTLFSQPRRAYRLALAADQ